MTKIALTATFFVASTAQASPEYPSILKEELDMPCPPTCMACHTVDPGVRGTASRPFAQTLKGFGLVEQNDDSLIDALNQLKATEVAPASPSNSDDDEYSDINELKGVNTKLDGTSGDPAVSPAPSDPNDGLLTPEAPGETICDAEINYGCGATISRTAPEPRSAAWWVLSLGLLGLGLTRRKILRSGQSSKP